MADSAPASGRLCAKGQQGSAGRSIRLQSREEGDRGAEMQKEWTESYQNRNQCWPQCRRQELNIQTKEMLVQYREMKEVGAGRKKMLRGRGEGVSKSWGRHVLWRSPGVSRSQRQEQC